jgi:hypothetical protein
VLEINWVNGRIEVKLRMVGPALSADALESLLAAKSAAVVQYIVSAEAALAGKVCSLKRCSCVFTPSIYGYGIR